MSNQQQTRLLTATQIQQNKKRDLRLLSRARGEYHNFDHGQERQIIAKSLQDQLLQSDLLNTRSAQSQHKFGHNPERLIAALSLQALKQRQQSILSRAVPELNNHDELDFASYWWLTPSVHRLALTPSSKKLCPVSFPL